jgi:hypothetical protein
MATSARIPCGSVAPSFDGPASFSLCPYRPSLAPPRSSCQTNKLSKSHKRVMPGGATRELRCDGQARLATVALKLACVQRTPAPGLLKHVTVELLVEEDTLYPRNHGKRITLDRHDGFWDFIHVWVAENKQALELTIDYGVLE